MLSIFTVANLNTRKYRILRVPVLSDSVIVWTRPRFSWKGKLSEVITDTLKNLRICYHSIWTSRSHFQSVVWLWWWVKWTFVGNSDLHFENLSANHHHHQKPKNLEPMFFQVITLTLSGHPHPWTVEKKLSTKMTFSFCIFISGQPLNWSLTTQQHILDSVSYIMEWESWKMH